MAKKISPDAYNLKVALKDVTKEGFWASPGNIELLDKLASDNVVKSAKSAKSANAAKEALDNAWLKLKDGEDLSPSQESTKASQAVIQRYSVLSDERTVPLGISQVTSPYTTKVVPKTSKLKLPEGVQRKLNSLKGA